MSREDTNEPTADLIDAANALADALTQNSVAHYRALAAPEQDANNVDPDCCDCGEPIEEGRLQMLKKRCFSCQTLYERKMKTHAW